VCLRRLPGFMLARAPWITALLLWPHEWRLLAPSGEGFVRKLLDRLWQGEEGQDLAEYALVVVLIGLAATAATHAVGIAISKVFANASSSMS